MIFENASTLRKLAKKQLGIHKVIKLVYFLISLVILAATFYLAVKFYQILTYILLMTKLMKFSIKRIPIDHSGEFIIQCSKSYRTFIPREYFFIPTIKFQSHNNTNRINGNSNVEWSFSYTVLGQFIHAQRSPFTFLISKNFAEMLVFNGIFTEIRLWFSWFKLKYISVLLCERFQYPNSKQLQLYSLPIRSKIAHHPKLEPI